VVPNWSVFSVCGIVAETGGPFQSKLGPGPPRALESAGIGFH
jgi:hypothetical protein